MSVYMGAGARLSNHRDNKGWRPWGKCKFLSVLDNNYLKIVPSVGCFRSTVNEQIVAGNHGSLTLYTQ